MQTSSLLQLRFPRGPLPIHLCVEKVHDRHSASNTLIDHSDALPVKICLASSSIWLDGESLCCGVCMEYLLMAVKPGNKLGPQAHKRTINMQRTIYAHHISIRPGPESPPDSTMTAVTSTQCARAEPHIRPKTCKELSPPLEVRGGRRQTLIRSGSFQDVGQSGATRLCRPRPEP